MLKKVCMAGSGAEAEDSPEAISIIQGREMDDLSREIAVEVVSKGRFSYVLKVNLKRIMQRLLVES